ncbi:MAG: hypothetical protein K6E21_05015 [Bacilli bacterium]|nr:hypothetical protein [Bacilli bacterium]
MDKTILNMISAFMEVGLVLIFIFFAFVLIRAAIKGYKQGIYKSTYFMVGYALLFILALITMRPITRTVYSMPLDSFFKQNPFPIDIALSDKHIQFDLTISTVEATLTDFITGVCNQINASESLSISVSQFAKTLTASIISFTVYSLVLELIVTFGTLFLFIMWKLCFEKLVPKVAQRVGKIKFIGMAENLVTRLLLFYLTIAPFSSLINAVNQGIQNSRARDSQSQYVKDIVNLVDIYNDSLFAQVFFNWQTGLSGSNITFDQAIMDHFTKALSSTGDAYTLAEELGNLTNALGNVAACLGDGADGKPIITEFSENLVNPVFDLLGNSPIINDLFQISVELALNTDLLVDVLPNYQYFEKVDIGDISLNEEIEVLKGMANDVFETHILDDFIVVDNGEMQINAPSNLVTYLDNLFTLPENREKVNKLFNVFNRADDLKLLNACYKSLGYWAVTLDDSNKILKFLGGDVSIDNPYDDPNNKAIVVDFIKEFDIGHEMYTIFDSCWGLAACGDHVIKNAYDSFRSQEEGEDEEEFKTIQQNAKTALASTLRAEQTTSNFRDAICGINHMNEDGSAQERDSTKGEHYALMDSKILAKFINETPFMRNFLDNMELQEKYGSAYEEANTRWNNLMNNVYDDDPSKPLPIKFFKEEINHILTVVTNVIQLEIPTSSSITPSPLKTRFNDEIEETTDEKKPFEYKDYPSFLDAVVNAFDGWINPDDIFGSAFDLDSRIAPYLGKAFECLQPLDESKIVYALGIPFIDEKLAAQKEKTQEFFDVDIIIYQLNHSDDVFAQLADFMNGDLISALQHFYKGFMMNDEGQFAFETLTNSVKDDIDGFLDKFNVYLEVKPDNPDTAAYDPVLDEHPLKYYFANILKAFYNFELFNPHSGTYKNKNMQNMFDFIFGNMEEQGVERPSDDVYAELDPAGKWEEELDAISNLFGILGENNMLKFNDFSSSINSTLLYSLAGDVTTASTKGDYDPNMPKNLGDVLSAVGDSVLFSNLMGGLLDANLNDSLCDATIGVTYKNINSKEYWHEEGENMSGLLLSIAKLDLDLQNLDLTKVTDVVGMNDMLHKLSDSLIFKSEDGNKFGEWLHKKVDTAMASMSEGLLNDPESSYWDSDWDAVINSVNNENYPNQKIAHYDFLVRDEIMPSNYDDNKAAWNVSNYDALMTSFKNEYHYDELSKTEADELYMQDGFIEDYYDKVLQYDEIGRVVNVVATGIKIMDGGDSIDFNNITANDLDNFLTATNNTNCLRIASYNAMKQSKDNVGTNDFVDINKVQFEYLITANASIDNYALGRANRQEEIDHIVEFYSNYKEIQRIAGDDLNADSFFNKATLMEILGVDSNGNDDSTKKDYFTGLLAGLQATHCFNLSVVEDRTLGNVSFFEDMMINMMNNSGLTDLADATPNEIEARVKKLSNHDFYNTVNDEGFNSIWTERNGDNEVVGGETACFVDVFKKVINATKGDEIDANNIAVTDLPASEVTNIMKAVNGSYLCTGVMSHFVKDAFSGEMGLEELLKYDPSDTEMIADFDLDYLDYGGSNNNCGEGTEIYCIQKAIESMQYEDPVTHEYKFVDLDDFQTSLDNKKDCLDGVFYFLFNSKTLAKTEIRDSVEVKGRSVMLYNALDNFDSYLIGSNKANKIDAIEKLFDTSSNANGDKAYLVEANGLTRLTDEAGNFITNVTIDTLRANSVKRNMILNLIKYSYDRNDGNEFSSDTEVKTSRSYFTSEIVSGIFDDVLTTEYGTIYSSYSSSRIATFTDYEKFYFASNQTNGRALSSSDITTSTFDNLNEVERRGLQGAIELTRYFNGEADRSGTDISNIESNLFITDIIDNKDSIREIFTDYFYNDVENKDSRFAKILFVSRGALSIEKETATANNTYPEDSGLFVILKYTHQLLSDPSVQPSDCVWFAIDGYREDYYDSSFNFRNYGNDLMDYIESC